MSQIEVGEVMGITDEAVELLLARARRTLKVSLKEEWRELMPRASRESRAENEPRRVQTGITKTDLQGVDMSNTSNTMTIAEFERLLDIYGSDRTRWPVEARASAGHLVARDRAARRLLAEAEALDRALERAPLPTLAQEAAIAERIVGAAKRTPRIVPAAKAAPAQQAARGADNHSADNVVRLSGLRQRAQRLTGRSSLGGVAAGALAASLVVGILIGHSNLTQPVLPAIEQLTGITLGSTMLPSSRRSISWTRTCYERSPVPQVMRSARSAPRWMQVALLLSLAGNLVIIGLVAGAVWRFRPPPHIAGSVVTPNLLGYASTLPTQRRKALWDATAEERSHVRPYRREVRAAREETVKALTAEPFDRQQFKAAQARQAETENRPREAGRTSTSRLPTA